MIESYTQKIFFVDEDFLKYLEEQSVTQYNDFTRPQVDTQVIQLPVTPEQVSELVSYMPPSEIRVGNVLARTSYTDQFGPLDDFADEYAARKYQLWVQLCIALGAKKVSINSAEDVFIESQGKSDWGVDVAAQAPLGSAEVGVKRSLSEIVGEINNRNIELTVEAVGGAPDLLVAEAMLKQYGLLKDQMFRSIFDMRRITSNHLVKHEYTLDFAKDMKNMFDSSTKAKLSAMNQIYEGRVDVSVASNSLAKSRTAMKLSVVVEF